MDEVPAAAVVRVLRGEPTAAELVAVLVALLPVRRTASSAGPAMPSSEWCERSRAGLPRPGPGAWRFSTRMT